MILPLILLDRVVIRFQCPENYLILEKIIIVTLHVASQQYATCNTIKALVIRTEKLNLLFESSIPFD